MNKVEEKAKELGQAIIEDERFVAYKKAEIAQASDEELQTLLKSYEACRTTLIEANQNGASEEIIKNLSSELDEKYKALIGNKNMMDFMKARQEVEQLLAQVNGIIDFYVTGEEPHSCSGNCASCGGCH